MAFNGARGPSDDEFLSVLYGIMNMYVVLLNLLCVCVGCIRRVDEFRGRVGTCHSYSLVTRVPTRLDYLHRVTRLSDIEYINHLMMNRDTFSCLCTLLETAGGLTFNQNSNVSEQVAVFLSILSHHTKNCVVKNAFIRWIVSRHFHSVLNAVIQLHPLLLVKPEPINDDCPHDRWKCFKGCLGTLDGTYVSVTLPKAQHGRYRNRKGDISVNVLGVCDINMNYVYVLAGWEGSAADSRVLRAALARPHGLRVPRGCYYLCDTGYANSEGFLTPYRGTRYHLVKWSPSISSLHSPEEYFNMKHSREPNVIERGFAVLKKCWAILRSPSFYPIKTQNRIIMACCLLHNFIRTTMGTDPLEIEILDDYTEGALGGDDYIASVETSHAWITWHDQISQDMYNHWRH